MNVRLFLSLIIGVSIVFISSCNNNEVNTDCYNPELKAMMADTTCPGTALGVCACNGVTYVNECEAMKDGYHVAIGDTLPCPQLKK